MTKKLSFQELATLAPRARPYEVCDSAVSGLRLRVQPSGVKTYVFSYRNAHGIRRRLTIGRFPTLSPTHARKLALKAAGAAAGGQDPQQAKVEAKRAAHATSLETFLEKQYGPWVLVNRRSGSITLKRIRSAFIKLLRTPLTAITPLAIERWRTGRLRDDKAPATVDRELSALKAVLSAAVRWKAIALNPIAAVKLTGQAGEQIVRYLTRDDELRLRKALETREARYRAERKSANRWRAERGHRLLADLRAQAYADHLQPMVLLSLNTGLRRGELFRLEWRDINLNPGLSVLTVRAAAAKSGRSRQIPLNQEAAAVLAAWRVQQGKVALESLVFEGRTGEHFNNTKRSWGRLLKDASISAFRWHDMRHHFASRLVMAGVDLNTVRELLGHADLKMTLRYAHLAPEHKAAAVQKLMTYAGGVSQ